jgi:two-component system heavy metal sensor histidine kinase CusS
VFASARFPDYTPDAALFRLARETPGKPLPPWTAQGGSRYPYRMTLQAVRARGESPYLIESGYSMRPLLKTPQNYRRNFVRVLLPLALVGVAGGWWLAKKSLAPIARMADAARAISHESLDRRIPVQGTDDELDRLAAVLNGMLERLEEAFSRIDHFSADLAHELRTPLTALKGEAERALPGDLAADELRSVIAAQSETVDRLNALIADLLFLARTGGRPTPAASGLVDLRGVIRIESEPGKGTTVAVTIPSTDGANGLSAPQPT